MIGNLNKFRHIGYDLLIDDHYIFAQYYNLNIETNGKRSQNYLQNMQ